MSLIGVLIFALPSTLAYTGIDRRVADTDYLGAIGSCLLSSCHWESAPLAARVLEYIRGALGIARNNHDESQ